MSVFTREDKLFVEYLKDYFEEEMKSELITRIATFDDREYTFFFSERTTLEIRIIETEDDNGRYIKIVEDEIDDNSSEYILKIAEFMKTHKFIKLYENLKNYYFIPCKAEEIEKRG